jgi:hypothetical protein
MTFIRYARLGALASLAAALALAPAGSAGAHDHDENPGPGPVPLDRAAALAADVAIIAADTGWSLDATRRHLRDQQVFGALQDEITSRFPATFAGAEFATAPGGRSYLRFKGPVPAGAAALAEATGLDVGLTGGRKYSALELQARADAIAAFLVGAGYRSAGVAVLAMGGIDVSVTTEVQEAVGLPPALADGVRVTYVGHEVATDHHTYGGARVSGGSTCTSGFTVESLVTGVTGVTTAAHCGGVNTYFQPQSAISYPISWQDQHIGLSGDVEWHTTPNHTDYAVYYADLNEDREVNSVETSAAVNNTYCVYSRMQSNRSCDQVYSTYVVMITSSGVASNLVAMDDSNTVGGDSGGPWSLSTEAAGGVKGALWLPFKNHDTWSKAWLFDSAIDVAVLTQ